MKQSPAAWSRAYAVQARADLDARTALLSAADLPACQHLHFLQMACEKVSKAHRCWGGTSPEALQHGHVAAAKVLPLIAKQLLGRTVLQIDTSENEAVAAVRMLAREVELLAPSVDDGGRRPDNSEYPWEDDEGALFVPAEYRFSTLGRLHLHRAGATFLKILATTIEELAGGYYTSG